MEKIENDDLDLFYVYFSSIMSYKYVLLENSQNSPKKFFQMFLPGVLTQSLPDGTDMFSLLMFYQMLNNRSEQHSLLHFLTGKLDETGFPHPSMAI